MKFTVIAMIIVSTIIGCGAKVFSAETNSVTGRLIYPEDFLSPSDTVAYITLSDVSPRQDTSSEIIVRQVISYPSQRSIPFKLEYNPQQIRAERLYAIQARVTSGGRVVLTNTSAHLVITQGNPTAVEVYVGPNVRF